MKNLDSDEPEAPLLLPGGGIKMGQAEAEAVRAERERPPTPPTAQALTPQPSTLPSATAPSAQLQPLSRCPPDSGSPTKTHALL